MVPVRGRNSPLCELRVRAFHPGFCLPTSLLSQDVSTANLTGYLFVGMDPVGKGTDMTDGDRKLAKKMAKAQVKEAKKGAPVVKEGVDQPDILEGSTPAERAAAAAERQVALQRWRVAFALVSTLIALGTLVILFLRNR